MQILVLGMHRSGTSMVARLLNMMGAYFAPEGTSLGANQENPKGFWERRDVWALDDMVLHSAGADWHRVSDFTLERIPAAALAQFKMEAAKIILDMDAHRPWFLKEPRFCLLAPLWLDLLEVPVCVIVNRSPIEVARSLQMRNGFPIAVGLALWECYNIAALNATRGQRRIQINHADLMADPVGAVRHLQENLDALDVHGLREPSDEEIRTFIDPSLYRAKRGQLLGRLSPAQRKLWRAFENGIVLLGEKNLKISTESQEVLSQHDRWLEAQDKIAELSAEKEKLLSDLRSSVAKAEGQRATIQKRNEQVVALQDKVNGHAASLREMERKIRNETQQRAKYWEMLQAALKRLTNLAKWSDRLLQEHQRILSSNRWLIGCWLSFKRAGQKSKEAQRLARLIESRPRRASGVESLMNKGKPNGMTGTPDFTAGPSAAATSSQHITKKPLNPLLNRGVRPSAVPKPIGRGRQLVSIVIPVYNAYDDLIRCLESVQSHSRPEYPVIVIDDASPDERIWPLLQQWATQHQNFRVVRNDSNHGYTATVNRGCELAGPGDIILLNSDTIVSPHWIEQMSACAYSRPRVATVTAVSNAAGAFSVPRKNAINELPPGWSVDQMAAFIQRTSQRIRPVVPTGHGFCMYITNAARTAIGSFDAERFPGYGEENDYCLRASAVGFVNLIDDATYIFHRQSASFGAAKEEILKRSRATLDKLYPEYMPLICYWSQVDVLNPVREEMQRQLDASLAGSLETILPNEQRFSLLLVVHDGGGGVEIMTEDLSLEMARRYHTIVLRTALGHWTLHEYFGDDLVLVRRYSFAESWRVDRPMTSDRLAVIAEICADYKVDLAHVHHLLANGPELLTLLRQLEIPIVCSLHDFYMICPTIQLLDETQTFCAGQCTAGAGDCPLVPNWFRPPLPPLKHRYVHQHRSRMSAALQLVDACVTNSEASRSLIAQHFPALGDGRFTVIEYGRDLVRLNLAQPPAAANPLRAVCFGALGRHKGIDLVRQLLEKNLAAGNPLEIHVLGEKSKNFDPESLGGIYHGPYHRDELVERIRAIRPAVSLVPSLWPETYCYVLTESWAMGLPVLASDIGTLRERVLKHGGGWLLPVGDAEQWFAKMLALRHDQQGYAAALAEIQKMEFPGVAWMAEKYDAIYQQLLARRPATSPCQTNAAQGLTEVLATRPQPASLTARPKQH
jgi:GT2 family glycosyltransferase/glycosyltransferase involved in cell wall biosynthesis